MYSTYPNGATKPDPSGPERPDGDWQARSVPGVIATMSDEVLASLGTALASGIAERTLAIRHEADETEKEAEALRIRIGTLETERAERDAQLRKAMANLVESVQAVLVSAGLEREGLRHQREFPAVATADNDVASQAVGPAAGGAAASTSGRAPKEIDVPFCATMAGQRMNAIGPSIPGEPTEKPALLSGAAAAGRPNGTMCANPGVTPVSVEIDLPSWIVEAVDALVASGKHEDRREAVVDLASSLQSANGALSHCLRTSGAESSGRCGGGVVMVAPLRAAITAPMRAAFTSVFSDPALLQITVVPEATITA